MSRRIPVKIYMFPNNSLLISLLGVKNTLTGDFFDSGATVTATLYDQNQNPVPGCTDVTLSYVLGSNGFFRGVVIGSMFQPTLGTGYSLRILGSQAGAQIDDYTPVEIVRQ